MPPAASPGSTAARRVPMRPSIDPPRTPVAERAARIRFRRALALMAMTLVVPGSAQLVAGSRRVGRIALRTWLALIVVALVSAIALAIDPELGLRLAFAPGLLLLLRLGLVALALGWAFLIVDAWRLGQPLTLSLGHRRAVVGVNGVLCFGVAGTLLFGAHLVNVQRDLVLTLSGDGVVSDAHDGRYNVLLIGGDSGPDRWGLRPDSMTVASIDASTGRTVLISMPRNLKNFTFPAGSVMARQFPKGFDADYLNGVNTWAQDHKELFPGDKDPGMTATISAIEGVTDLKINYWAMVNLRGFSDLVDAVGGVTLNVRTPIPIGGIGSKVYGYVPAGTHRLTGHQALWYARSRADSDDYSRMARQKCVLNAMLQQISPQSAIAHFSKIADASAALISTDLPASQFGTFAALALKARGQRISTLSLVPPLINTGAPDMDLVHRKVAEAIAKAEGDAPVVQAGGAGSGSGGGSKPKPRPSDQPITGGSVGTLKTGYVANQADDLGSAC
ncbi:LCP family protein [Nocardioides sp. TRM66260-LWL]|uniref:LCP family protein n=1 Tax=Nocardioides sp. TRM66260-LWL TaxID=2874478 RepID=UPI001CC6637A|nr:LCP family protein [Nocardioides sp. TRM66260-LWL]MBZ5735912.1 LCP family protein [Nocardioides sp. TRM66260-LWL]